MNAMDPKKFYNEEMPEKLGPNYERARWHSDSFREAQYDMMRTVMRRVVAPRVRGAHAILEVGPGQGTWTRFLFEANPDAHYTLVDISAEMLARAEANLPRALAVSLVESDFLQFISAQPFDIMFSSRAIEYMPDKAAVATKITSLLAPGGYAILATKMPKRLLDSLSGRTLSELHQGQISPGELAGFLRDAGLSVSEIRMATATVPGFKSALLNRVAFVLLSRFPFTRLTAMFAESYVIIAKRP
jgi:trans-aconitate methyltransferase